MAFIHFDNGVLLAFFLNSFLIKNASLTMFVHSPPPFPSSPSPLSTTTTNNQWRAVVKAARRNVGSIISVYSSRYLVFCATVVRCLILPSRSANSFPPYEWFTSPVFLISNLSLNFKYWIKILTYRTTSNSMVGFLRLLVMLHFAVFLIYTILPFFFSLWFLWYPLFFAVLFTMVHICLCFFLEAPATRSDH